LLDFAAEILVFFLLVLLVTVEGTFGVVACANGMTA